MATIFGDTIEYKTTEEVYQFIENMKSDDCLVLLEAALTYAGSHGVFSMIENFAVFSAISKLKFKQTKNENQDGDLRPNDSDGVTNQ